MTPQPPATYTRRSLLSRAGAGLSLAALAHLWSREGLLGESTHQVQFPARANRVIWLFMHGGPSHVDLFDPKPELTRFAGQPLPGSMVKFDGRKDVVRKPLLAPVQPFRKWGQSGIEVSELLPHFGAMADDLCVIRSCHGDSVNHPQSVCQWNTGSTLIGKPSMGAWVSYGLGSENESMPAFVVLPHPSGAVRGGPSNWGSGFLPASFQGTALRPGNTPILDLRPAATMTDARQKEILNLTKQLNEDYGAARESDARLVARTQSYELAYRMQKVAPEIVDITRESAATQKLYGIDEAHTREFGSRCLLARRLVERGVRFVQLYAGDTIGWDAHEALLSNHTRLCAATDKPIAGLLLDLKSRGLLEDTLVIWGGEFGRMPMSEKGRGRDHNPWGYTTVFCGGGVKSGYVHGATDDFGLKAAVDPVHVSDLHATILHLLGIDHERLTYHFNGLDQRLTGVSGRVVQSLLA